MTRAERVTRVFVRTPEDWGQSDEYGQGPAGAGLACVAVGDRGLEHGAYAGSAWRQC
jgi:hypothetical protein